MTALPDKPASERARTILKVGADVKVPHVPNFLIFANGSGSLDVADVTDEALRGLAAEWTKELLANAQKRRRTRVP